MRALVLDYPDDPNVTDLSTQYMFGKFLLVAPVLEEGFGDGSGEFTLTRYRCDRDSTRATTITLGRPERPHLISVNGDPLSEAGNKPDNWSLQKEGTLVIMVNGVKSETVVTCGLP